MVGESMVWTVAADGSILLGQGPVAIGRQAAEYTGRLSPQLRNE